MQMHLEWRPECSSRFSQTDSGSLLPRTGARKPKATNVLGVSSCDIASLLPTSHSLLRCYAVRDSLVATFSSHFQISTALGKPDLDFSKRPVITLVRGIVRDKILRA